MIFAERIRRTDSALEAILDERAVESLKLGLRYKYDIIASAHAVWIIKADDRPVFLFGVTKGTFLGHGVEMWFLPCKGIMKGFRQAVPFARRGIDRLIRLYGHAKATVSTDFPAGQRFVEYFGFTRVGEIFACDDKQYYVYERRAPWLQQ